MKLTQDLTIGDVIRTKLAGDKQVAQRVVTRVIPRTGLTRVWTHHKADVGKQEIHEIPSDLELVVN